jgi:Triose-phosphate Transporter family
VSASVSVEPPHSVGRPGLGHSVCLSVSVHRYLLNVGFNLQNKTIFNYFPFPWTVSAVHVVVGLAYLVVTYFVGAKDQSFGRVSRHARASALAS